MCLQFLQCCRCSSNPSMPQQTTRSQSPSRASPLDLLTLWSHGTGTFIFGMQRCSLTRDSDGETLGSKICWAIRDEWWLWTWVDSKYFCQIQEHQSAAWASLLQDSGSWLRERVPDVLTNIHDTGGWWRAGLQDLTMRSKLSKSIDHAVKLSPWQWGNALFKAQSSRIRSLFLTLA